MEFRLLGPVEVIRNESPVQLGGRQRRTLLAILAVLAGERVSTDRLIEELWGEEPPKTARKTVQAHIARLRAVLNVDGEILAPAQDGYVLQTSDSTIDIREFEAIVEEARNAHGDPGMAVELYDRALGLFRGSPLAGVADDTHLLRVEAARIEELRLSAIESQLDMMLKSGLNGEVAAEAERLLAEHPLRERIWGLLMLGLYRAGRQADALGAFSRARGLLASELGIEPSPELITLEQQILEQDQELDSTSPQFQVVHAEGQPELIRNPYKGLRAFDESDSGDFHGREDLTRRLLERLDSRSNGRLVVLAGPSGAGKSSVVRAGLVPALRDLDRDVAIMFPGFDPLTSLAKAISEVTSDTPDDIREQLEQGQLGSYDGVVVIDQFEELFTLVEETTNTDRLLGLCTDPHSSVTWVATVRADFLNELLSHPATGPTLEESLVLVPPLQDHEVQSAVVRPAARVGVEVEPDLVARIILDVQNRSSALPLLQFALTDAFDRRSGDSISLAHYERSGGITGALARRADALYESLDEDHRDAVRQLFLNLVGIADDGQALRRRVDRSELLPSAGDAKATSKVIERFGLQRLLTFDQNPETGQPTVEVAHEALIAEWPQFRHWVESHVEDLRTRQRLRSSVSDWLDSERDPAYLLTGSRLAEFVEWSRATELELAESARLLIDVSAAAEVEARQTARRRRRLLGGGAAAAILTVAVLGSVALSQRAATEEQERLVRVGDLAGAAVESLDVDADLAILLALEAVETTRRVDGTVLGVAEQALHEAVLADRMVATLGNAENGIAHFSPDGTRFVALSEDDERVARIWSVDPLTAEVDLQHGALAVDAVFSSDGRLVATTSLDDQVRLFDSRTGEVVLSIAAPGSAIPVFSNDGSVVAATNFSGTTTVWDASSGEVVAELPAIEGFPLTLNLEFSPDDAHLAVAHVGDGIEDLIHGARLWDVETGELVRVFEGHTFDVTDVGFTPDGSRLVTSSRDATAKVFDVASGELLGTYFGHGGPLTDLQVSSDGTVVATAGFEDVRVWDLETRETIAEINGHRGEVDGIDISDDGGLLLTSSRADKTTRLWDLTPYWSHELAGFPGSEGWLGAVSFSPDGTLLAASRGEGTSSIWNLATYTEDLALTTPGPATFRLVFSSDQRFLAGATVGGGVLWDARTGEELNRFGDVWTNDISFDPTMSSVLVSAADGLHLWHLDGGEVRTLVESMVIAAEFHPDRSSLVVSHDDETPPYFFHLESLDAQDGSVLDDFGVGFQRDGSAHNRPVERLAFNEDGSLLITGGNDAVAVLWDTSTYEVIHRLEGNVGPIFAVAFDPTRDEVATAGADGVVRLWNTDTGILRMRLPVPDGALGGIAYSSDGRYLATSSNAGFVTVFVLDVDELTGIALKRLTRWWTPAECRQHLDSETCPEPPSGLGGLIRMPLEEG